MKKYQQVALTLRDEILRKRMKSGERISSIREISKQYGVSKSTVIRALETMVADGIVYCLPQSGYYYALTDKTAGLGNREIFDFASSTPDQALFPYKEFQHCINQAIEQNREDLFKYGTEKGFETLKNHLVKVLRQDQIYVKEHSLVITNGTQQSISILFDMTFYRDRKKILIEQPSYHVVVEMLQHLGMPYVWIERKGDGYDFEKLEELFRSGDVKCFYLMPRVHNPLGTALSHGTKQRLVRLARKYQVYLIEDDYMGDYISDVKNLPLYAYDDQFSHVVYLKSFSKIIFPGLRIGFAVLPETLIREFTHRKIFSSLDTSMLSQAAMSIYIKNGMYHKQREKMKHLYKQRADILQRGLSGWAHGSWEESGSKQNMIHTCIRLKHRISPAYFLEQGFEIRDIGHNYLEDYPDKENLLVINTSNISNKRVVEAIRKLKEMIGHLVSSSGSR